MHVLLAESMTQAGAAVAASLQHAGHTVSTCRNADDGRLGCAALREDGSCPLEQLPVDVFVLVRSPGSAGCDGERGALCAASHRVPLVIAGSTEDNPYRKWQIAEQPGTDVVALVEDLADRPLRDHSRRARKAMASTLGTWPGPVRAEVRRRDGGLDVELAAVPTPSPQLRAAAATRVHQELRALDPWASFVNVSFQS